MRKWSMLVVAVLTVALFLTACSKPASPPPAPAEKPASGQGETKPKQSVFIKIAHPTTPQIGFLPSLMATQFMGTEGIVAEQKFMTKPELALQALMNGEVDIAFTPAVTPIQAVLNGAKVSILMTQMGNEYAMMAPVSIKDPKELSGKRIAIHSETSVTNSIAQWTIKQYGIKDPKILVIPGSAARTQALKANQIDASPVFLSEVVRLNHEEPGKYHALLTYSTLMPDIVGNVMVARQDWLEQNPDLAKKVVKAFLQSYRKTNSDPAWAAEQATVYFNTMDPKLAEATINEYVKQKLWDNNGGLDEQLMEKMLKFFKSNGDIKADDKDLVVSKFANLKPLQDALAELGKK